MGTETGVEPVLDPNQIKSTIGDDPEIIREFVELAMNDIEPRARALETSAGQCGGPETQSAAHAMKGVALSLGAKRLGDLMREIERAARDGDAQRIREHAASIGPELQALKAALSAQGWGGAR